VLPLKSILVLEDESVVMNVMRHMLRSYSLMEASTVEQALNLFQGHRENVGLLLADLTLAVSSGVELALLLRQASPFLPVIVTSGYPVGNWSLVDGGNLLRLGTTSVVVLQKPFRRQLLLDTIFDLMGEQPVLSPGTTSVN
jgi:CheY-like chemotaxis protein